MRGSRVWNVTAIGFLATAALVGQAPPTHSLLFGLEGAGGQTVLNSGNWLDLVDDQEVLIVTPEAGVSYSARKFHTTAALRATLGDTNAVAGAPGYADGAPAGELDVAFLPYGTPLSGPVRFSDLWISFNETKPAGPSSGHSSIDEGDVVQFLPGGAVVKQVTRAQINTLINRPVGTAVDVDAMTLDPAGNLYYSDSQNGVALTDGGLWQFPAGTWGPGGFAVPASALVVLTEAETSAMVAAATGGAFNFANDLTGIDLDPNGGTFTATRRAAVGSALVAVDVVALPNFIFCVKAVPGNVFSTAGGGSLATLNGVTLGGPFPVPTPSAYGPAVGVSVGTATYLNELGFVAVVPFRDPPLVADYRNQLATPLGGTPSPGAVLVEVGATAPFGYVNVVLTTAFSLGLAPVGGRVPSLPFPGFDYDDLYLIDPLDPLLAATLGNPDFVFQTDYLGGLSLTFNVPPGLGGAVVVLQPAEIYPLVRLGQPAVFHFL